MGHGASASSQYPEKLLHSDEDADLILLRAVLGISSGRYYFLQHLKSLQVYQSLLELTHFRKIFLNGSGKSENSTERSDDICDEEIKTEIVLLLLMSATSSFKESDHYAKWLDLENDPIKHFDEEMIDVSNDSVLRFVLERHREMRDTFAPPYNWVASIIKIFKHSPVPFAIIDLMGD